ncbi:MAG: glycosyltransferase family 4 protein [Thermodesulfobacteriota bacterium]
MRIGIIRGRYNPYGGAEVFVTRFIEGLREKGHEVVVFSAEWPESEGVTLHRISSKGPSFLRPLLFAREVQKAVVSEAPDYVISFERTFSQDIYRAGDGCHREWLTRRKRTVGPLKRLLITLNPKHRVLLYLEKRLFTDPRLKKVVANSRRGKEEITRLYGLRPERICVIYNGIDLSKLQTIDKAAKRERLRKQLNIAPEAPVLLFVGSGFERKGLLYLIRALALLPKETKLVVIGKGHSGPYKKEAQRLGAWERVIFLGAVKGAVNYYPLADVFVLPSIYEPFSNACLEAMASGLPVVSSRVGGVSEVIVDGLSGGVAEDPTDPKTLAASIRPFLNRDKAASAGTLARKEALTHTMDGNVEGFLKLIDKM